MTLAGSGENTQVLQIFQKSKSAVTGLLITPSVLLRGYNALFRFHLDLRESTCYHKRSFMRRYFGGFRESQRPSCQQTGFCLPELQESRLSEASHQEDTAVGHARHSEQTVCLCPHCSRAPVPAHSALSHKLLCSRRPRLHSAWAASPTVTAPTSRPPCSQAVSNTSSSHRVHAGSLECCQ